MSLLSDLQAADKKRKAAAKKAVAKPTFKVGAPPPPAPNIMGQLWDATPFAAVPTLMSLLDRAHQATQALETRGPGAGLSGLIHGVSPAQENTDRATLRSKIPFFQAAYSHVPHPVQGLMDFGLDMANDPLTYVPFADLASTANKGLKAAGVVKDAVPGLEGLLPTIMQAAKKIKNIPALQKASDLTEPVAAGLHDFFTMGGHADANAQRIQALKNGAQGATNVNVTRGLRLAATNQGNDISSTLNNLFEQTIAGLDDKTQKRIYTAIHFGRINKLPAALQPAANRIVQITRSLPALAGSRPLLKRLGQLGHELPAELQPFLSASPRGLQKADEFRVNYLPMLKSDDPEWLHLLDTLGLSHVGKADLASLKNAHLLQRPLIEKLLGDAASYRQAMKSVFSSGAKQIAAHDLRSQMMQRFAPVLSRVARKAARELTPEEQAAQVASGLENINKPRIGTSALTPEQYKKLSQSVKDTVEVRPTRAIQSIRRWNDVPYELQQMLVRRGSNLPAHLMRLDPKDRVLITEELTKQNRFKNAIKALSQPYMDLVNAQKSAMFYSPFGHQRNIGTLLALHAPQAIPRAIANYAKMKAGFASPDVIRGVLGDALKHGATGLPNQDATEARKALNDIGSWVGTKAGQIHPALGAFANLAGKAAGSVYDASSKALWGWDNAAKEALNHVYLKRYGDPALAAFHTQRDLINYHERSPFVDMLAHTPLAPFANYRTQMPLSVLRAIAKNPRNAAAISRIEGGLYAGGSPTIGGKKRKGYSPLSETSLLFDGPDGWRKYARASLGPTGKMSANAISQAFNHDAHLGKYNSNWWMYGHNYPSFAAHSVPPFNDLMQYSGQGMFKGTPADEALYQLTGVQTYEH